MLQRVWRSEDNFVESVCLSMGSGDQTGFEACSSSAACKHFDGSDRMDRDE